MAHNLGIKFEKLQHVKSVFTKKYTMYIQTFSTMYIFSFLGDSTLVSAVMPRRNKKQSVERVD